MATVGVKELKIGIAVGRGCCQSYLGRKLDEQGWLNPQLPPLSTCTMGAVRLLFPELKQSQG